MAQTPEQDRKIIHIDMDAFYASVEQRDDPALRGLPVAVGGGGPRGVVAAASYEARVFGVRSAMPGGKARRLCPELIFVRPRFEAYRAVSQQIRAIFERFTDIIQPLSLDEAYLDVTRNKPGVASATYVAQEIRRMIREETGLTASAGVSCNKLIAKLASDQNKPDGLCVVRPDEAEAFMAAMPVSRIHGVGPVTARRMAALGIHSGADLKEWPLPALQRHFGKAAAFYFGAARGLDERPVRDRESRKSISVEDTFASDIGAEGLLLAELEKIAARLWGRVTTSRALGRTVTLKIKLGDFRILTRSRSLPAPPGDAEDLFAIGADLLRAQLPLPVGARLLGLGLSNLIDPEREEPDETPQLSLAFG
ncbi:MULTISPECIES: DNA polymerase IV [unclassified Sphingobium]|uniref:DNA polymerase IV n=1 Tax=unclassified Sphingobium TaxID=2611147 RepID=UPI002223FF8D|nr:MULTISPECIES: DNA polymerase IV [unclassified Sphingobium]MCW2395833.1 DNA polymerase-4 [Sphingobium sp. B8D3B]MCW2419348.1 DNA polymerase-4 [Sphingobium sp. B8D3C]